MTNSTHTQFKAEDAKIHEAIKTGLFDESQGPIINSIDNTSCSGKLQLHVSESLKWFDGHFPLQPVLPGVVQLDWACKIAKSLFVIEGPFSQFSNIKFKSVVMPNSGLRLELEYNSGKGHVKFHYLNQEESFSMGTIKYLLQ